MISLSIDGRQVEIEEGKTILEAAESAGIKIPTLCYHKALPSHGACRLCVVEITGRPRLAASCAYLVEEGIEVKTASPRVLRARKLTTELLLLHCPDVPKLRELAEQIGVDKVILNRFKPDNEKCILCGLCARVCRERMRVGAIDFVNRGYKRKISPPFGEFSPICVTCGACEVVCPTGAIDLAQITKNQPRPIPSEYDEGLVGRGSIYIPFPQAIPKMPVIDRDTCMHFLRDACKSCENFCGPKSIDYVQQDETVAIDVGAIIVATGFGLYDPLQLPEYGYGKIRNVITAMEYERLTSAAGPTAGELECPSDGKIASSIAFIQCVGSRDFKNNPYCSSVCCMHATKEAIMAYEHHPGTKSYIFYMDLRAVGKQFQEYVSRAKAEYNVTYIRARPGKIDVNPQNENPIIWYEDTTTGETKSLEVEIVVLCQALIPSPGIGKLATTLGVSLDKYGFPELPDGLARPVDSNRPGVFFCGYAHSPRDIPDSVTQASAAAARVAEVMAGGD